MIENAITDWPRQCNAAWQVCVSLETSYSDGLRNKLVIGRSLWKTLPNGKNKRLIINPSNVCDSVSDIYKIKIDFEWAIESPSYLICEPSMFQPHLRPMSGNKFSVSEVNGRFGDYPQMSGREPQSNCRESENNREACDKLMLVSFEKIPNADDDGGEGPTKKGAVIFFTAEIG